MLPPNQRAASSVGAVGLGGDNKLPTLPFQNYVPTVFENYTASFEIDKHRIELNMWDTSGKAASASAPSGGGVTLTFPGGRIFISFVFLASSPACCACETWWWRPCLLSPAVLRVWLPPALLWLGWEQPGGRGSGGLRVWIIETGCA